MFPYLRIQFGACVVPVANEPVSVVVIEAAVCPNAIAHAYTTGPPANTTDTAPCTLTPVIT